MNIREVSMLSRNLRQFYRKFSYPTLFTQIGDHAWFLYKDKITESLYSLTHRGLSEEIFL